MTRKDTGHFVADVYRWMHKYESKNNTVLFLCDLGVSYFSHSVLGDLSDVGQQGPEDAPGGNAGTRNRCDT